MIKINMPRSRIADLSLLSVAMMWGCTFLIVQNAVQALPPLAFNAIRFIGASLLLAIITTLFYRNDWRRFNLRLLGHGVLLGLFLCAGYGFQTVGLLYTTTSNAGFITGLSVVLVPFLSVVLFRHKLSVFTWISAILAAAGLYLLTFTNGSFSLNRGDALILFCALAFALHIGFTGLYAPRYPALPLATIQLGVTGLFSLAASLMSEHVGTLAQTTELLLRPEVLLALLVSIGPTSAFAFWIQTVCQNYTSPARVAVIFAMEPVFAAITGVLFAGEQLGWSALLGSGFIFTGMILAELKAGQSPGQRGGSSCIAKSKDNKEDGMKESIPSPLPTKSAT